MAQNPAGSLRTLAQLRELLAQAVTRYEQLDHTARLERLRETAAALGKREPLDLLTSQPTSGDFRGRRSAQCSASAQAPCANGGAGRTWLLSNRGANRRARCVLRADRRDPRSDRRG